MDQVCPILLLFCLAVVCGIIIAGVSIYVQRILEKNPTNDALEMNEKTPIEINKTN